MRADKRLATTAWTAGLLLGAAPLAAQEAPSASSNTPAADAVGPRELQNFSLSGTVVRPADQPPVQHKAAPAALKTRTAAEPRTATRSIEEASETPAPTARQSSSAEENRPAARVASAEPKAAAEGAPASPRQTTIGSSVTTALPPIESTNGRGSASVPAPAAAAGFAPQSDSAGTLAPEHGFSLLPWLLAAAALGAGAVFLFWRGRAREAFAGGPQLDSFIAPEPAPPQRAPRPDPVPAPQPRAALPLSNGIVSTRLRPWIDVTLHPVRCIVEEAQVTFDFELELFNSGSAPARAVLVEATVFNASPAQDQEIGAFFAKPVGEGDRIAEIPPLKRLTLRSQVVAPRDSVQVFQVAGRQVFVPLIAFNALYRWGASEGQSSVSYLLGRDTKGEKMAPFRLDLGPRVFRGLGARPLPVGVRT